MLKGVGAIVTGATSGIGRSIALRFVAEGARVVATGRNAAALDELKKAGCHVYAADLTHAGAAQQLVDEAVKVLGGLTTVVNAAGVLKGGAFGTPNNTAETLRYNFDINFFAAAELMRVSTDPLLASAAESKDNHPSIINISSINGSQSYATLPAYCASKAALDMFSRVAAVDLGPRGVRVNVIAPGVTRTELQKRGGVGEDAYQAFVKRSIEATHPIGAHLGRIAEPDEVADLATFLASSKAAYINGAVIPIDGGRLCIGAR